MKNALVAACGALALASTKTQSAQTPPPTPAPPGWPTATAPAQPDQKPAPGTMTIAGCLKVSDSTVATASGGARYVLANAAMERPLFGGPMGTPTSGAPAPGAPGAAAPPAHPMATQYMVVAGSGVDLAAHVNHQVRITGTVAGDHSGMPGMMPGDKPMAKPDMPATRPTDAPKPNPMGMDHKGADKGSATLTASSITMISATCTVTR